MTAFYRLCPDCAGTKSQEQVREPRRILRRVKGWKAAAAFYFMHGDPNTGQQCLDQAEAELLLLLLIA